MTSVDYNVIDSSKWWQMLGEQKRYAVWCLWTSIGSMILGFDYVIGGQLATLEQFQRQFGIQLADGMWVVPAQYLSAFNSIGLGCYIVTAWLAAPLMEKLATEWTVHLAGRAVNGIAVGIMFTISPLWIGETCRPELRGFWLCFFNTSIVLGQMLVVIVSRASSTRNDKWQWWVPVICMYIFPFLLIIVWPWFPESPYWLVREGKSTDARKSLKRMYGIPDGAFYDIEIKRLQEDVYLCNQYADKAGIPRKTVLGIIPVPSAGLECFERKNLQRTLTAMCAASSQQIIGASFIIGNASYFLFSIGVKDYFNPSVALYIVMLLASAAAFPLSEIIGRRTMIVPAQFVLVLFLLLIGIAGCINTSGATWAIIVFIYLWAIVYQLSIGATGFVLASEIATLRLRAVTQALVTFHYSLHDQSRCWQLGGKVDFIFCGLGLVCALLGFFYYPETKGVRFEELDELFEKGVSPRQFDKHTHDDGRDFNIGLKQSEMSNTEPGKILQKDQSQ